MAVDSVFEPRVSQDGVFTPITVVVQQLFLCLDVSGSHQDQVRAAVNGVKLSLAVSSFTVVDESPKAFRLLCSVHTEDKRFKRSYQETGIYTRSHNPDYMRTFFSFEWKYFKECDS